MDGFPLLSPEEAKARLPAVKPLLAQLREAFHSYKFAKDQTDELLADHGPQIATPGMPDHEEYAKWSQERDTRFQEVERVVHEINTLGADVKDPILGLIDFFTQRGNDIVLLCYRDDEKTIEHWHPTETGFAGRRPLSEL